MNTQFRAQVYLDEERYLWLKEKSEAENKSFAQVFREVVDVVRGRKGTNKRILAFKGKYKDMPDVSEKHDKYLNDWVNESNS